MLQYQRIKAIICDIMTSKKFVAKMIKVKIANIKLTKICERNEKRKNLQKNNQPKSH